MNRTMNDKRHFAASDTWRESATAGLTSLWVRSPIRSASFSAQIQQPANDNGEEMIVSVINLSNGRLSDLQIQTAIRAINRQLAEDFLPHWGFGAVLRLEGRASRGRRTVSQADMRGDAVLYLLDQADVDDAEGYHDKNFNGIPYGFVFLQVASELNEAWTVTFSHEALELVADPEANLLVQGPHPTNSRHLVYYWFEMCDAVQDEKYKIDGVEVSNFILPLYFTSSGERKGRNDFLGARSRGKTLQSFNVNPGGYVGFFDPRLRKDDQYFAKNDAVAARRLRIKRRLGTGRGNLRKRRTLGR